MDRETLDKILEIANPAVVEANGEKYVLDGYTRAQRYSEEYITLVNSYAIERETKKHKQDLLKLELSFNEVQHFGKLSSLSGLCEIIKAEIERDAAAKPYFVIVENYSTISVYGSYEANFSRKALYSAVADNKDFNFGQQPLEQAIITLQSRYVNSGDVEYILDLLARTSKKSEVTSEDNGVTQKVQTNRGISLKNIEVIRNRVKLSPFRTFLEVNQPESEFLLRLADIQNSTDILVSLIESDGGAWKLTAKANIANYLRENLAELIADKKVIVLQ